MEDIFTLKLMQEMSKLKEDLSRNFIEISNENYRREERRHREVEARQFDMLERLSKEFGYLKSDISRIRMEMRDFVDNVSRSKR